MELAARLGGGHDAEVWRAALGVDLNALALAAALGEPVGLPPEPTPSGGACVRFLVPPEGELAGVEGLDEARAAEGVVDARVYRGRASSSAASCADPTAPASSSQWVVARRCPRERAGRAADSIRFETEDAAVLQQT